MERTGERNIDRSVPRVARLARRLQAGCLLLGGVLALGGCVIVPAHHAYVAPARVYLAPAPVIVAPAPVYYGWGGPYYRHGRW